MKHCSALGAGHGKKNFQTILISLTRKPSNLTIFIVFDTSNESLISGLLNEVLISFEFMVFTELVKPRP